MNDKPEHDDDDQAGADEHGRTPVDPEQLAFLTRHMGRVIGDDEWGAALGRPKDKPPGGS